MAEWQDISTAPKDGTPILALVPGYLPSLVQWVEFAGSARWSLDPETFMEEEHFEAYFFGLTYEPQYWQPVPAGL